MQCPPVHTSMEGSLRPRRAAKVQYGRRARQNGSSPAQVKGKVTAQETASPTPSDSSDAEGNDPDFAPGAKPKTTPKELSRRGSARAQTASPKKLPTTPSPFTKTASATSTSKLPSRLPRSGSPSLAPSSRTLKRSASASPRKLDRTQSGSLSPSKGLFRSRTPTRPAKDLGSLFDVISSEPRNPFARSESHPVLRLQQEEDEDAPPTLPREPQSPTLGLGDLPPLGVLTSPTKRARLMERMAPRAIKADKPGSSFANIFSRNGTLRKTETDPEVSLHTAAAPQEDGERSGNASESGSVRGDTPKIESQEQNSVTSRRMAGIKQEAASNAKRTYGLQRSFLADHAEENLLAEPNTQQPPAGNIEDEIESQLLNQPGSSLGRESAQASSSKMPAAPLASAAPQRESYADLLRRWGEGADEIEWDESQNPTLNLKSITSLRSVGELRRFNDDLEYLFSGLEAPQPLPVRRSSAIEFVRMLCGNPAVDEESEQQDADDELSSVAQSAEFLRKLKATDKIVRAYDLFRVAEAGDGVDDVLEAAFGIFLARLLRTPGDAEPLIRERRQQMLDCMCRMLLRTHESDFAGSKDGFARLRFPLTGRKNAHADHRKRVVELQAIAKASKLFLAGSTALTLRNLVMAAACSLAALPKRWLGDSIVLHKLQGDYHHPQLSIVSAVTGALEAEGNKCKLALTHYTKGAILLSAAAIDADPSLAQKPQYSVEEAVDLDVVDLCIRFLEKLVEPVDDPDASAIVFSPDFVDRARDLITFCLYSATFDSAALHGSDTRSSSKPYRTSDRPLQVVHGLIKLLLDLSHVDPRWSDCMSGSAPFQCSLLRALFLNHQGAVDLARHKQSTLGKQTSTTAGSDDSAGDIDRSTTMSDAEIRLKLALALRQDIVHLALALLTDLLLKNTQTDAENIRDTLAGVSLDPACLHHKCAYGCICAGAVSSISLLARLFLDTRSAALEQDDSDAAYLSNSVATALAQFAVGERKFLTLCREALDEQAESLRTLKALHAPANGFNTLLDAVEEFAAVHQAAFKLANGVDMSSDAAAATGVEAGQLIKDLASTLRAMSAP